MAIQYNQANSDGRDGDDSEFLRDLSIFVGKNADYYERKWRPIADMSKATSWNWAAFLFPWLWLTYRKMYVVAIPFLAVAVVVGWLLPSSSFQIGVVGSVVCGLLGNYIYYHTSIRTVTRIRLATADPATRKAELTRRGGTSWRGAIIMLVIVLLVFWFLPLLPDTAPSVSLPNGEA